MSDRIRQTTWGTGERYCMLVDADTGMPPWYPPMLFITTQLRQHWTLGRDHGSGRARARRQLDHRNRHHPIGAQQRNLVARTWS